jgi:hypothetical protein
MIDWRIVRSGISTTRRDNYRDGAERRRGNREDRVKSTLSATIGPLVARVSAAIWSAKDDKLAD